VDKDCKNATEANFCAKMLSLILRTQVGKMARRKTEKPRGLLNPKIGQQKFTLTRYFPAPKLEFFVEHYWIVRWDLRGQEPYVSENLPHPTVHLVFQQDATQIYGVTSGKFSRRLTGKGQVLGVKFRPGAFYPFVKSPISQFTDDAVCLEDVFGVDSATLEKAVLSVDDDARMVEQVESFLCDHLPERDENITLINQIVDHIIADRSITKVDDVVTHFNMNKRTLQRLFNQYVGVNPKWVIQRYRLQDALEQLADGETDDCAQMALNLGYFDQAHFINDFKMLVGKPPVKYTRQMELVGEE
jgi:AraC-like DNA-binding protein